MLDRINDIHDINKIDKKDLPVLASEIREFLINNVSVTGGHLASNLGVVELTIALLRSFNFDEDKIVFDVGHQSYVYKILTGRKDKFNTLRKKNGLSGFPKLKESKYDFFETGHSSTSISAAIGMARARDLNKDNYHVISLIGDGALTGGMAYEALNDVGDNKTNMIIILNDNEMSISNNVGGLSHSLNKIRISSSYNKLKEKVHIKLIRRIKLTKGIKNIKNKIKSLFISNHFFEDLGIRYIGPIGGHNIDELEKVFNKVKNLKGPTLIHVITKKGLGYEPALSNPDKFHGIGPFDIKTGDLIKPSGNTYSKEFGNAMVDIAKNNQKVVAITASMPDGTGLNKFKEKYNERFFDIGIAEEHAVTFAAGLATSGYKPVFAVYSSFLQRGIDQIIHDVCMQKLPVVFAVDRAGLVGEDGKTHQGIFDLSYLSMIPNMTIIVPKCVEEIKPILEYAINLNKPVAIRYPRGGDITKLKPLTKIVSNKWEVVSKGDNIAIIAVGKMVGYAILAKEKSNKNPMVINATFVKPLDNKLLEKLANDNYRIITIEDNTIVNGFGEQVLKKLNELGYNKQISIMGISDKFVDQGTIDELYTEEKINVNNIVDEINKLSK